MSDKSTQKKKHLSTPMSFRKIDGKFIIYVNNIPDRRLTMLFGKIDTEQSQAVATYCIRLLYAATAHLLNPWNESLEEWRTGIQRLLVEHYGVRAQPRRSGHVKIYCNENISIATIQTVLARFETVCNAAIDLGWLDESPLSKIHLHRAAGQQFYTKHATHFFSVEGSRRRFKAILENDDIPQYLRDAAEQAKWSLRDRAILEILLCSGARISEVVEMTWDSYTEDGKNFVLVNKKSRSHMSKYSCLSDEALKLVNQYIEEERIRYDPMRELFIATQKNRVWTSQNYMSFLKNLGESLTNFPLFLTQRGKPYTVATFRRRLWNSKTFRDISIRPHQIRHWYINRELDTIFTESSQNEFQLLLSLQNFVRQMGWSTWTSLKTYDHRGLATALLARYDQKLQQLGSSTIQHGGTHTDSIETAIARAVAAGVILAHDN